MNVISHLHIHGDAPAQETRCKYYVYDIVKYLNSKSGGSASGYEFQPFDQAHPRNAPAYLADLENKNAKWVCFVEFSGRESFHRFIKAFVELGPATSYDLCVTRVRPTGEGQFGEGEEAQLRARLTAARPDAADWEWQLLRLFARAHAATMVPAPGDVPRVSVVLLAPYVTREEMVPHQAIDPATTGQRPSYPWLIIDSAAGLSREAIGETIRLLCRERGNHAGKNERTPAAIRSLAPSPWGPLSLRERVFQAEYPVIGYTNFDQLVTEEFSDPSVCEQFLGLCKGLESAPIPPIDPALPERQPVRERIHQTCLYVLQMCRRLSTYTIEGVPFVCTVLLANDARVVTALKAKGGPPCGTCIVPPEPVPFTFSEARVRAYAEVAQSEDMIMVVDVELCYLTRILVHRATGAASRRRVFRDLACRLGGVIGHPRGNGLVEVYDQAGLTIWFDGFRWELSPYRTLVQYLRWFYELTSVTDDGLTCLGVGNDRDQKKVATKIEKVWRIVGAVMKLIDRRGGTILVFTNKNGMDQLKKDKSLTHVNKVRQLCTRPWDIASSRPALERLEVKKDLPLGVLVEWLMKDGAHVILDDFSIEALCLHVEVERPAGGPHDTYSEAANGTGTVAAQRLSAHLKGMREPTPGETAAERPKGFVVKVSADRVIHVYDGGWEV